jgi:hypothetical protein
MYERKFLPVLGMVSAGLLVWITVIMARIVTPGETVGQPEFAHCKMVYLDVGSNIGVQVRKLFEPARYPQAEILPLFDHFFGTNRNRTPGLCAIGIEMNPKHTMRLSALEYHYTQTCGYSVRFFKETAATTHGGWVDFWTGGNKWEDGASQYLKPADRKTPNTRKAHALDLVEFILQEILPVADVVVMKMDIEGSEFDLLPLLVMKGAACNLDLIFVETHPKLATSQQLETYNHAEALFGHVPGCKVQFSEINDETYQDDVDDTMTTC